MLNLIGETMKMYDIVVAGHICLDLCPAFETNQPQDLSTLFRPGRLINMDGVTISTGGAVSNTGFALSKMGLRVLPAAKIGDDPFGVLIADIAEKETGSRITMQRGVRSSYSIVLSPPGIDRIILHDPAGNNEFSADDIDYSAVAQAGFFHYGYPPVMRRIYQDGGCELVRLFASAKEAGAVTSMDMSLPDAESESGQVDWVSVLARVLPYVDLFMPSAEEALYMLDRPEYERVAHGGALNFSAIRALGKKILGMGAKLALIKCGIHGIYIKTSPLMSGSFRSKEIFQPSYVAAHFKSALGSGDTAIAGFVAAMVNGHSLIDCARIACASGALCCTTYDAISAIRPIEEIIRTISGPLNNTTLPDTHLHYDERERIYTI